MWRVSTVDYETSVKCELVSDRDGRSGEDQRLADEYNGERPDSSLGYRTPNEFAEVLKSSAMTG
jgi:hypothetical protein